MNTDVLTNSFLRGSKMFSFNTEKKVMYAEFKERAEYVSFSKIIDKIST